MKRMKYPIVWTQWLAPDFVRLANLSSLASEPGVTEEVGIFLGEIWMGEDQVKSMLRRWSHNINASRQIVTADQ